VFHDTIATVMGATALTLCVMAAAGPAHAQQPPSGDDPLLAPPGRCAGDDDPAAHHRIQRLAMHCLLNQLRRTAHLPKLRSSPTLRRSATYKARRIAACKIFTHYPCGDALEVPFQAAQLSWRGRWRIGEDLAWAVVADATARTILAKWLRSPTHRHVLLARRFTYVGVRRRRLSMVGAPVGAVLWVAHLGERARR
jgi:hypothetical protein